MDPKDPSFLSQGRARAVGASGVLRLAALACCVGPMPAALNQRRHGAWNGLPSRVQLVAAPRQRETISPGPRVTSPARCVSAVHVPKVVWAQSPLPLRMRERIRVVKMGGRHGP